ncbi:hypothetical protein QTO34_020212 [Cnephaeus nilssonii]|uniref:Uncharacterized protein n=1 Tax=Cnephaeus nilssonii TaxID=3371016 RepID=A0AA40HY53_CNENI|nr:hypothetical protein QTO34_020212 [Eptesicus nilssonii]
MAMTTLATVFFDHINYEDALKILQYSEPYKVQFKIKRKLPAAGAEDWASSTAQHTPKHTGTQDEDVAEGSTDTPVKTLERDGDQERLISKSRGGRGRRAQRERLSWPKFQTTRSQRGPRRSHSSSEAYEGGQAPDGSPTSSDTEAQFLAEERERMAGAGSQRRRRFLNLRFKVGSGKGPSPGVGGGHRGREALGGTVQTPRLAEAGSWGDSRRTRGLWHRAAGRAGQQRPRRGHLF